MAYPSFEFHVSRKSRDRYQFDGMLFAANGNILFANFHSARIFAQKMNDRRDLARFPEQAVRAGDINAMGLIDEVLHLTMQLFRQQKAPLVMSDALDWLYGMLGKESVDKTLLRFCEEFPPLAVYKRQIQLEDYLDQQTNGIPNIQIALEELIFLWLANANPAFAPFYELFDHTPLEKETSYSQFIPLLHAFFETQPVFGPDNQNLLDMLRAPAIANPHLLAAQLEYIRQRWGVVIERYLYRLLSSLDFIKEEEKTLFGGAFLGPGPARVYEFRGQEFEPERFSADLDWMPSLVLMAKNAYVWLDQLSKKYHRPISRLSDIPNEELDALSRWGFTGLWFIGLWERSAASKNIKIMRGNPDAVASAYSLYDYAIASDLGGEEAYQNFRDRAWQRGIRLASDMVPNHMGIDSRWVLEHPEWFISLDYPPFPSYTFNGPNFSPDPRISLQIEDHYFTNTDAAVVFKRTDNWSGQVIYIYHGNDGTSMPWNDTAQLNYLNPEVREAVIQTILSVARKFHVIRFDAAMTLAKKHYQRLWYPEPGTGGAIPSRADYGITREDLEAAMPVEFWREVVDRVAQEVPDTLLLAEAFWLMEGYFVRTLGMHRVYNSAFMNMLRDEKNAEYRQAMKNTLEFDPEVLKRYVNFMNNPDERTAVDQFGRGDKYFGICTLMATLPGLPMFGHGQIEGFTEKYGMEYRRAYWDETPDGELVNRHIRETFPLLRKRYLYAQVEDYLLYDFYTPGGLVDENVFAYSNRRGDERSVVIYHNKYASTRGWIKTSAAYAVKQPNGEKKLVQRDLAEGLGLSKDINQFVIYRDHFTGLEYIQPNKKIWEDGLYIELDAYKTQVLVDFHQVQDNEWHQYNNLYEYLSGNGVPSIDEALREIFLQPVHRAFRELVNAGFFQWLQINQLKAEKQKIEPSSFTAVTFSQALEEAESKSARLLSEIKLLMKADGNVLELTAEIEHLLEATLSIAAVGKRYLLPRSRKFKTALKYLASPSLSRAPAILYAWVFTASLGKMIIPDKDHPGADPAEISRSWIDEWLLGKIIAGTLQELGMSEDTARRAITLVKILVKHRPPEKLPPAFSLHALLSDVAVQSYIGMNRYQDVLWFNKETFEELVWWLYATSVITTTASIKVEEPAAEFAKAILDLYEAVQRLLQAESESGFQVEKLLEASR
jgi:glycosidase